MKLSFILGCQDEKRTDSFKDNLCMKTKNLKKKRKLVRLSINSRKINQEILKDFLLRAVQRLWKKWSIGNH